MSLAWILVPLLQVLTVVIFVAILLALIVSTIIAAASGTAAVIDRAAIMGLVDIFEVPLFILSIFNALMFYRLVKRRNSHFTRQLFVYEDLARAAKEAISKKGLDASLSLNNLDLVKREAAADERIRDPVLWSAILVFAAGVAIPSLTMSPTLDGAAVISAFAQYYVYYFLMKDWFKHERREDYFFQEFSRVMSTVGVNVAPPQRAQPIPNRSFIVYLILLLVTASFYGVYWVYVLLSDPNNHFHYQAFVEDATVRQLSAITV